MPWRHFAASASAGLLTRRPFERVMVAQVWRTDYPARRSPASHAQGRRQLHHDASEGRAWKPSTMEALILVADLGGPTMFARIGVMRALNRHHVREFDLSAPSLGKTKAEEGRIRLKVS